MAQSFLGSHEVLAGGAVNHGARVEAVLGAQHGRQRAGMAHLHRALDHHVQVAGGGSLGDDRLARSEVADVDGRAEGFGLRMGQAVEGWVRGIEAFSHGSRPRMKGRPPAG